MIKVILVLLYYKQLHLSPLPICFAHSPIKPRSGSSLRPWGRSRAIVLVLAHTLIAFIAL
jgi:hypothetical protein